MSMISKDVREEESIIFQPICVLFNASKVYQRCLDNQVQI